MNTPQGAWDSSKVNTYSAVPSVVRALLKFLVICTLVAVPFFYITETAAALRDGVITEHLVPEKETAIPLD